MLFTGIVLLIGSRSASDESESQRRAALEVVVPTLFAMLLTSFLFAVITGEGVCRRGQAEALLAGGLLALASIATFQSIAWMLKSYEDQHDSLELSAGACRFAVALVALMQIALTVTDVQIEYPASTSMDVVVLVFLILGVLLIGLIAYRWWRRRPMPQAPAWWAAPVILGYSMISLVLFDLVANKGRSAWEPTAPQPLLLQISIGLSLLAFLPCAGILLLGAPPRRT